MKSYFSIDCTKKELTTILWRAIPETDEEELLISLLRQRGDEIDTGICGKELYEEEVGKKWYLFQITGIVPGDIQESNQTFKQLKSLCEYFRDR